MRSHTYGDAAADQVLSSAEVGSFLMVHGVEPRGDELIRADDCLILIEMEPWAFVQRRPGADCATVEFVMCGLEL